MKKISIFLISIILLSAGLSCQSSQKKNAVLMQSAKNWFNQRGGNPAVNINGNWVDTAFASWGSPQFTQAGNEIIGTMGLYNVQGVINNKKIYLIATSGGYLYYTIILESINSNTLRGKYADGFNPDETFSGSPFILKRKNPKNLQI